MNMQLRLKLTFTALFIFCVLPQVYSLTTQKELFPWSPYSVYSGVDTGTDLILLSAYFVDQSQHEEPVENVLKLRPKYEYRSRIDAEAAWKNTATLADQKMLLRFGEIFKDDMTSPQRAIFHKVRFYLEYWKKFTGPKRFQPDERKMIFEYPIQP